MTKVEAVNSPLNARIPNATNAAAEWYAVLDFMSYTVARPSKRVNKLTQTVNVVNKRKFKVLTWLGKGRV